MAPERPEADGAQARMRPAGTAQGAVGAVEDEECPAALY
jgi:hypothetical protein